jgi:phosphoribosylaminoimidazole-succinocarboxamide synthase
MTPSTKGVMSGIPGVPEVDDVNVSQATLKTHWAAFKFREQEDVEHYARLLTSGFSLIETALAGVNQIFVDTKFEFGYAQNRDGVEELIYMDEVGTPDSSRIWDGDAFAKGDVVENSKEGFRQALLNFAPDPDVLLNKNRMEERLEFARNTVLPTQMMLDVSETYVGVAERIMGEKLDASDDPRAEIIQVLRDNFDIIDPQ